MESVEGLKSVEELREKKFFIPSYQRGYRWTEQQVKDLLNDINDFKKERDGKFYCLQPLVVCQKDDGRFNVIDGQQRLTTLYLIINELSSEKEKCFDLEYEREKYIKRIYDDDVVALPADTNSDFDEFWNDFKVKKQDFDKIENYYLLKARFAIRKWLKDNVQKAEEEEYATKLLNDVKFIWYPISDSMKEHEYFKNLNSGKIPLMNAELIKALFLNSVCNNSADKEISQSLIADEFDQMERTLRDDDFWYFLAGQKDKLSSCIELLFELMLDSSEKRGKYKDKNFRAFFYFKEEKCSWEEVRKYFYILDGWYKNPVTYNLIGYLRSCEGATFSLEKIYSLYNESNSKTDFVKKLKEECKNSINFQNNGFMKLTYGDNKLRNLLLFLNIATLLSNRKTTAKFQFADYHKENWDVEHISPQNPKIDDVLVYINNKYKDCDMPSVVKKILEASENDATRKDNLVDKFFASDDTLDSLANHTLLPASVNRSIGNGFFCEKRQRIIEYYQDGVYIPPCSMNVFQKFYTVSPNNMDFWDKEDQEQYREKIQSIVTDFFTKE